MSPTLSLLPIVVSNEQTQDFIDWLEILYHFYISIKYDFWSYFSDGNYSSMPLVSYSDGGYIKSGMYMFVEG